MAQKALSLQVKKTSGGDDKKDLRYIVGASPRRCIFYIVVTRHVFCSDSDLVICIFG